MTDLHPDLDHHLAELQQVATELRAARRADEMKRQAGGRPGPGTIRTTLGRACLAAASALLDDPGARRLAAR